MKLVVCVFLVASLVVLSNATPIKEKSHPSRCADCDKAEEALSRTKRTPDGQIIIHEKRSESHSQSYERTIEMRGNNPTLNQIFVGFGQNNENFLHFGN